MVDEDGDGDSPREGVFIQNRSRWEAPCGVLVTGIELDKGCQSYEKWVDLNLNDSLYKKSKRLRVTFKTDADIVEDGTTNTTGFVFQRNLVGIIIDKVPPGYIVRGAFKSP